MRLEPLPASEFERRVKSVQEDLQREGIDVLIGYSSENESATSRFFTGFWPFFDFASVVVPSEGRAVLVTGGPESYEFAKVFSQGADIVINPLLVETSAPDWVPEVSGESFTRILPELCGGVPERIGIGNWNIFPHVLFEDLEIAAPGSEFLPADDLILRVEAIKTEAEIPYIIEAYRITEEAMKAALTSAQPGKTEWELEAAARTAMLESGAGAIPTRPGSVRDPTLL